MPVHHPSSAVVVDQTGRVVVGADGPTFLVVWETAAHLAEGGLLLPEHLLHAALHHSGIDAALRVSGEVAREKLLRAAHDAAEDAKEDVESAGMSTATVEIVNEARRRADEQGHPTMLRHLLEALRASGGICEEVIAKGDLEPLERKFPKLSPGEAMTTTPYRTASRRADVYAANDDVTPMNVVIDILANVFALSMPAAVYACREAHYCGFGYLGEWPEEVAHDLVHQARERAAASGSLLAFVVEEAAK